jgi:ribosomal protein L11 methyltransferase
MSGFYLDDLEMIRQKAESLGLHYLDHKTDNDWTAARFQR